MKIQTLASGSKGNAALVWSGGTYILVDAGISLKRIEKSLSEIGVAISQLAAVLITHEHTDHISGLTMLRKHYPDLPVYSSGGTVRALNEKISCSARELEMLQTNALVTIGELEIMPFETPHDTAESVGYTFFDGKRKLSFTTDLGHISSSVRKAIMGSDTVLLESNHDLDMLWVGSYTYRMKQRISGRYGHLSNSDGAEFAIELCGSGASRLILAHLSDENNRPELALGTTLNALGSTGFGSVSVDVAPATVPGITYEV